jgi:CBS domain-containing protein
VRSWRRAKAGTDWKEAVVKVGKVYRAGVFSVERSDPLSEAASRMQFNEVGSLAVFDGTRFVGIVTERDLVRAMADGVDAEETSVREYMTEDPVSVSPDTEVTEAAGTMLDLGVRHLPVMVVDEVLGMVSARDLLADVGMAETG